MHSFGGGYSSAKAPVDAVPQPIMAEETTALLAALDAVPLDATAYKLLHYRQFNGEHCFCPEF